MTLVGDRGVRSVGEDAAKKKRVCSYVLSYMYLSSSDHLVNGRWPGRPHGAHGPQELS